MAAPVIDRPDSDEAALMAFVTQWQRQYIDRALLAVITVMHLWAAVTLLFAPDSQLFTQGSAPMFALAPPVVWAVAFAAGGVAAVFLLARVTIARQWATWMTVLPTQAMWLGAAVLAVAFRGSGSAMSVVMLSALLLFTSITAIYIAAEHTSGKR